jgi:hypothetical protein
MVTVDLTKLLRAAARFPAPAAVSAFVDELEKMFDLPTNGSHVDRLMSGKSLTEADWK